MSPTHDIWSGEADHRELRSFYDYVSTNIRSLKRLNVPRESFENMLLPVLLAKVPRYLKLNLARESQEHEWTLHMV